MGPPPGSLRPSRRAPAGGRFIHFPGAVNATTLVEDKRARARQAALAHAAVHHPPRALPKGRPAPAAAAAGAREGAGDAGA
jgi:hypothetical protein